MLLFYHLGIRLYAWALRLIAPFHPKAKKWIEGRVDWRKKILLYKGKHNLIWFHAASTGEMEMALPIIQEWKIQHPESFVFLSIYSPSAELFAQRSTVIDAWGYLPLDTKSNADFWVKTLSPKAAIFIKYDFWIHFLRALHRYKVPTLFSGSIFRPDQIFFKKYGAFYAKELHHITQIGVQDQQSIELLKGIGYSKAQIIGDTRFDRVLEISQMQFKDKAIEQFLQSKPCILVGSSWAADEKHYLQLIQKYAHYKWIIAPHELDEANIQRLASQIGDLVTRYTQFSESDIHNQVLILDTMGMLSKVYRYAQIALVGGGFGPGVHSLLEPAVYGIPVFFGPNHHSFKEAQELINLGSGFCYRNTQELDQQLSKVTGQNDLDEAKQVLKKYFESKSKVHKKVVAMIEQNIEIE